MPDQIAGRRDSGPRWSVTRREWIAGASVAGALAAAPALAATRDRGRQRTPWLDEAGAPINAHGGGILRQGDRWYWFGERRSPRAIEPTSSLGVKVYSSLDLKAWRDEGVALDLKEEPSSPIRRGCRIERPKVLYNPLTDSFVMWFHLELADQSYSAALAGVAVADKVTGPFRFVRAGRVNPATWPVDATDNDRNSLYQPLGRDLMGGQMARDMTVFVDAAGTGWHIYSSEDNRTLQAARLTDDFAAHDGRYWRIIPDGRNEAPAIFRARGRYYLITSGLTGWDPNPARSFVADRVEGPWTSLGNPVRGTPRQQATTFNSQGTFVLAMPGSAGEERFVFMADIWRENDLSDSRYLWLPIEWEGDSPVLRWTEQWAPGDR